MKKDQIVKKKTLEDSTEFKELRYQEKLAVLFDNYLEKRRKMKVENKG